MGSTFKLYFCETSSILDSYKNKFHHWLSGVPCKWHRSVALRASRSFNKRRSWSGSTGHPVYVSVYTVVHVYVYNTNAYDCDTYVGAYIYRWTLPLGDINFSARAFAHLPSRCDCARPLVTLREIATSCDFRRSFQTDANFSTPAPTHPRDSARPPPPRRPIFPSQVASPRNLTARVRRGPVYVKSFAPPWATLFRLKHRGFRWASVMDFRGRWRRGRRGSRELNVSSEFGRWGRR